MTVFNEAIPLPAQTDLWKMFNYHSDGYLVWKIKPAQSINIGDRVGYVEKDGYTRIRINGVMYMAHRLIYKFFKGDLDSNLYIDHYDNNPRNNRIENLQTATNRENSQKKRKMSNNTSGLVGVHYLSDPKNHKNPWQAYYRNENGKNIRKSFSNKYAAYHFYAENSERVKVKFYIEHSLSVENRHGYMDWLIEETDKQTKYQGGNIHFYESIDDFFGKNFENAMTAAIDDLATHAAGKFK